MKKQIRCCPFCGGAFDTRSTETDPRYPSGYECENCNEMLEIQVTQFPLA